MTGVVHFHDQANVAKNLVRFGRDNELDWRRVPRYPAFHGPTFLDYPYSVGAELLARSWTTLKQGHLHVHGGHLTRLIERTELPYILHLHGSEIRGFNQDGTLFDAITDPTKRAIEGASMSIFSTADLGRFVKIIRPDASWLPNPITPEVFEKARNKSIGAASTFDIFWPHVWSDAKGFKQLLSLLDKVRSDLGRPLKLLGVALGKNQTAATQFGFFLLPVASRKIFWEYNQMAKVTLGQATGSIGVSDIESMVLSNNFLLFPLEKDTKLAYESELNKTFDFDAKTMANQVIELLAGNSLSQEKNDAIINLHRLENVGRRLVKLYEYFDIR